MPSPGDDDHPERTHACTSQPSRHLFSFCGDVLQSFLDSGCDQRQPARPCPFRQRVEPRCARCSPQTLPASAPRAAPAGPPPPLGSPFTRLLFLEEFRARPPHSSSAVLQVRALSRRHRPTACQKRAPSARPKPAGRGMRGSRPTRGLRAAGPPRPNETPTRFSRPNIACELQTRQLSAP